MIGCTNGLKSRGLCRKHHVDCRRCSWKGCTNVVVRDGVCIKHGGGVFFIKHRAAQAPASNEAVCIKINNNTLSSVSTAQDSRVPIMMTYYHAGKEESSQIHTNVVRPSASKAYNGNGFVNNNMPEETPQLYTDTAKAVPVLPKKSSVPLNTSNYSSTNINMPRAFQLYNTATEVVQQPSASGINNNNIPTEDMFTNVVGGDRTNSIEQALTNAIGSLTKAVGYQEKMLNIALEQVTNQQESYCMQSLSDQSKSSHSHVLNVNGVSVSESSQFPFILYEMLDIHTVDLFRGQWMTSPFILTRRTRNSLFVCSKSFPNTILCALG